MLLMAAVAELRVVVLMCCALLACSRTPDGLVSAHAPDSQVEAALLLQHAGCLRVEEASRAYCELPLDRRLTFWCSSADCSLQASSARGALALTRGDDVEQGARYELVVPDGVFALTLQAGSARWSLALADAVDDPVLVRARELRKRGDLAAARAELEESGLQLSAVLQRRALAELARIALQQADYTLAASGLVQSFEQAIALGRVSEAIADGTALSYVLSANLRRFDQARGVLARLQGLADRDDTGRALLPHYQGVLALETGDLRLALRLFREAVRGTARLGLREHELLAREQEAWTLSLLGQHAAAIAAQRVLADSVDSSDGCVRADRFESVVWYALLAGADVSGVAGEYSERAQRALQACASPWRQRNHLVNAGLLAEQRGDLAAVQAGLSALAAVRGVDDPVLEAWELLLRGRYALRAGSAERALVAFRQAVGSCQRHGLWEPEQLAQLGVARSLQALGRAGAALSAYREAEALLDRSMFSVPLSEGLGGARHAREAGTYELMELLLQQRDTAGALAVARRARSRALLMHSAQERVASLSDSDRARWDALLQRYHAQRERSSELRESAWQLPRAREKQRTAEIAASERTAREALDEALNLVLANTWREPTEHNAAPANIRPREALRAEAARVREASAADAPGVREWSLADGPRVRESSADAPGLREASFGYGPHLREALRAEAARVREASSADAPSVREWSHADGPRVREASAADAPGVREASPADALGMRGVLLADADRGAVAEELEGRATVALFHGTQGVHGFASGCGALRHIEITAPLAAAESLAPLLADLTCASELRVIAPAALGAFDLASALVDGVPVLERWAVSYALDVPQRTAAAPQHGTLRVVDPRANLPRAAQEAELALPRGLAPVRTWQGAANRGDLLRELPGLALFHYAGHHRFAGAEGAESELLLSGATLSVGDVLTLSAAPRFVVLSACDSARLAAPGFSAGIDLAYAFVLSGARAVVAATRPVHDELGYALSAALYTELPAEPASERDLVRALRAAQLRIRREQPAADWSAFRVITP